MYGSIDPREDQYCASHLVPVAYEIIPIKTQICLGEPYKFCPRNIITMQQMNNVPILILHDFELDIFMNFIYMV